MYSNGHGGRRPISPLLIYGAIAVVVLFALYLVISLLTAGLNLHFSLVAGLLLLLINGRDLLAGITGRDLRYPLANVLVGAGLIFVWLTAISTLFWLPAIALAGLALPLALNRASYVTYLGVARAAADRVQRSLSRVRM